MAGKTLSNAYLADFCMELGLTLHAGVSLSEGIFLLLDSETGKSELPMLKKLHNNVDLGKQLFESLEEAGCFPRYMIDMTEIGERTGRLESTMWGLSDYFNSRMQLIQSVRNAVLYPSVLLVMMLVVVFVIAIEVMPIFNNVFNQLGSVLSGTATLILKAGEWIRYNWLILLIILAVIVVVVIVGLRFRLFSRMGFGRKIRQLIDASRFASSMSMALQSGLDLDEALELTGHLLAGSDSKVKIDNCRLDIINGKSFSEAVTLSGLLSAKDCRILGIGIKTGAADTVMNDIAHRTDDEVRIRIDTLVSRVEPTIVIVMSVMVGLILLSVMLPLMGIMSTLG